VPKDPVYFETPEQLRDWLDKHHETETELIVGQWKKASGHRTVTWEQIVDECLCFGWIDGIRRSVDDERTTIRITPRRRGSNWSQINIAKVAELRKQGRMRPAGEKAFAARPEYQAGVYSYEQRHQATLTPDEEARFRADDDAWGWFQARPPSYRTAAVWWINTAKRPETRERRLGQLIEESQKGLMPKALTPPGKRPDGTPDR
jgi:uncharacterized protein YdeI (YjbR/CyaY-like superfamily)